MGILGSVATDILALLVTLGILVTFHEFGHFWVARRCGVKVERFSIGFGKPLLKWRGKVPAYVAAANGDRPSTPEDAPEYVIAALPLGGYVKMLGEQDHNIPAHQRHLAFNNKPLSKRAAIVAAGPLANFLLAAILYWLMFMSGVTGVAPVVGDVEADSPAARAGLMYGDEILSVDGRDTRTWQEAGNALLERLGETGPLRFSVRAENSDAVRQVEIPLQQWLAGVGEPDPLDALGIRPYHLSFDIPPRVGEVQEGGRAEAAGLLPGDLIVSVNGEAVEGWQDWVEIVRANPERDLLVGVEREGSIDVVTLRPALTRGEGGEEYGYIGAGARLPEQMPTLPPEMNRSTSYSVVSAVPRALQETWNNTVFVVESIQKMLVGLISVENLGGPITIAQIAGDTASYGLEYFLGFLAVLSISLGVLNLLPIPVLDGGHLFYYLIEAVIRRPVPERIQALGMQLGILLIVGITFLAFYNDVNRLL